MPPAPQVQALAALGSGRGVSPHLHPLLDTCLACRPPAGPGRIPWDQPAVWLSACHCPTLGVLLLCWTLCSVVLVALLLTHGALPPLAMPSLLSGSLLSFPVSNHLDKLVCSKMPQTSTAPGDSGKSGFGLSTGPGSPPQTDPTRPTGRWQRLRWSLKAINHLPLL